jgi:hypothetical protein
MQMKYSYEIFKRFNNNTISSGNLIKYAEKNVYSAGQISLKFC